MGVILVNFHKRQIESLPFGIGSREEENVGEMAKSHICKNDYIILNENATLLTTSGNFLLRRFLLPKCSAC